MDILVFFFVLSQPSNDVHPSVEVGSCSARLRSILIVFVCLILFCILIAYRCPTTQDSDHPNQAEIWFEW